MRPRHLRRLLVSCAVAIGFMGSSLMSWSPLSPTETQARVPPNIVLIVTDDGNNRLRWGLGSVKGWHMSLVKKRTVFAQCRAGAHARCEGATATSECACWHHIVAARQ